MERREVHPHFFIPHPPSGKQLGACLMPIWTTQGNLQSNFWNLLSHKVEDRVVIMPLQATPGQTMVMSCSFISPTHHFPHGRVLKRIRWPEHIRESKAVQLNRKKRSASIFPGLLSWYLAQRRVGCHELLMAFDYTLRRPRVKLT